MPPNLQKNQENPSNPSTLLLCEDAKQESLYQIKTNGIFIAGSNRELFYLLQEVVAGLLQGGGERAGVVEHGAGTDTITLRGLLEHLFQ